MSSASNSAANGLETEPSSPELERTEGDTPDPERYRITPDDERRMEKEKGEEAIKPLQVLGRGAAGGGRHVRLLDARGQVIPDSRADLSEVKDTALIGVDRIDVDGAAGPEEIEDTESGADETPRDIFLRTIKALFREYPGEVYRADNIYDIPLGHRVNTNDGPSDFSYVVSYTGRQKIKDLVDKGVGALAGELGMSFSELNRNNTLQEFDLGFDRKVNIAGQEFRIRFYYGDDGSGK